MRIKLEDERRTGIIEALINFHFSEFDENISEFRAAEIVDFLLKKIGPSQYNQGIADARKYFAEKLDDLDTEFYEPEE
ncbi:DUF2164 domain-containing protein [Kiloniella sp.]|uniref:DUF2164 domain-containing protein n=1 Tax=Kiloniella sp. TaxID=1938587 RepID=UPI003A91475E